MYCLAITLLSGQDRGINEKLSGGARNNSELVTSYQLVRSPLFPFNGRWGFTANVVADPVDPLDFIDDTRRNTSQ